MPLSEFVISTAKGRNVRSKLQHIRELFMVDELAFTTDRSSAVRTGQEWIRISGEETNMAKEYIKSLCNCKEELEQVVVISPEYYIELTRNNGKHHKELERETLAVIEIINKTELFVQGTDLSFIKAKSFIEDRSKQAKRSIQIRPDMRISISNSRCSSTVSSVPDGNHSDIISRGTVPPLSTRPGVVVNSNLRDFAHKLGYSDNQIDTAALKLGNKVSENSLLHELISMPIGMSPRRNEDDDIISKGAHRPESIFMGPGRTVDTQDDKIVRGSHEHLISMPPQRIVDNVDDIIPRGSHQQNCNSILRRIVVDGSNVAMSHGNREVFSCKGIQICVDYFRLRGHKEITVFVPQWRKEASKPETPITNQEILNKLEKEKILVFTPSRRVNGRRVVCYDDRYIVRLASEADGIIVSNDHFRDLEKENPEWKQVIDQRLLMYTFVNDRFMPPDDPLGRHGPTLRDFLMRGTPLHPKHCPYGRKCTYGQKCKFYHPERKDDTQKNVNKVEYPNILQNTWRPPNTQTMSASNGHISTNAYDSGISNVYSLNPQKRHATDYGYLGGKSPPAPTNSQQVYPNYAGYPQQIYTPHQPCHTASTGPGISTNNRRQRETEAYQGVATTAAPNMNNLAATLEEIFGQSPEEKDKIRKFLRDNPGETNIATLADKYAGTK